jgi:hypothetical protein
MIAIALVSLLAGYVFGYRDGYRGGLKKAGYIFLESMKKGLQNGGIFRSPHISSYPASEWIEKGEPVYVDKDGKLRPAIKKSQEKK